MVNYLAVILVALSIQYMSIAAPHEGSHTVADNNDNHSSPPGGNQESPGHADPASDTNGATRNAEKETTHEDHHEDTGDTVSKANDGTEKGDHHEMGTGTHEDPLNTPSKTADTVSKADDGTEKGDHHEMGTGTHEDPLKTPSKTADTANAAVTNVVTEKKTTHEIRTETSTNTASGAAHASSTASSTTDPNTSTASSTTDPSTSTASSTTDPNTSTASSTTDPNTSTAPSTTDPNTHTKEGEAKPKPPLERSWSQKILTTVVDKASTVKDDPMLKQVTDELTGVIKSSPHYDTAVTVARTLSSMVSFVKEGPLAAVVNSQPVQAIMRTQTMQRFVSSQPVQALTQVADPVQKLAAVSANMLLNDDKAKKEAEAANPVEAASSTLQSAEKVLNLVV